MTSLKSQPVDHTVDQPADQPVPVPTARRVPTERVHHGDVFVDDYEWLRDKESPETLAHLEAENAYTCLLYTSPSPRD